jgi:hypothetical protein
MPTEQTPIDERTVTPTPRGLAALSKEAWAGITAIAVALISAIVTLATHFAPVTRPAVPASPPAAQVVTADSIAGRWSGTANDTPTHAFHIDVDVRTGCEVGTRCGAIVVSHVPCHGSIYLVAVRDGDHEFRIDDFVAPSAESCTAGAGEHFRREPDGSLLYTTTYDVRISGHLTRVTR